MEKRWVSVHNREFEADVIHGASRECPFHRIMQCRIDLRQQTSCCGFINDSIALRGLEEVVCDRPFFGMTAVYNRKAEIDEEFR